MKAKILGLLAVGMLTGPIAAHAISLSVSGSFTDGGTLSGSVTLPGSCDFQTVNSLLSASFTSTAGTMLGGASYSQGATATCSSDGLLTSLTFDTPIGDSLSLQFLHSASTISVFGSESIASITRVIERASAVNRVPEPGTLALLGLGLAGLGLSRRRKA